ncbi:peptidoglycan/LPS O-acetylase OafA/YrhL [Microbacterium sp. W4I4]|uniref:hypothetical protein n=1 Tax=Microbacterium sp. W4I4 TaxID=3042295 RepID=UPI00277FAA3E|nr:hypothetical protein [Microbacterium sp. W4I4]MDQ0613129.1 peptidoglycan/LPS O-acetylase OafA/YrhL [Microbacterium sp. W4I4]
MEQRPESGAAPLDPPSAAIAQAYLEESARVAQRREQFIDRRAAARLLLVEGAAFGVYLVALMFAFPPGTGLNIVVLIVPFLIWTQLVITLREEYGYQRRGREQRLRTAVVIIIAVMVVGALATLFLQADLPWGVRLLPGVLSFALYALLARSEWRHAASESIGRERTPFTRTVRVTTIGIGVALGISVASVATTALVAAIAMVVVMIALSAWLLTATITGGTAVATAWGAFHWVCFAVAGSTTVALVLLLQFTSLSLSIPGYIAGGLIALAFVVGALKEPERD